MSSEDFWGMHVQNLGIHSQVDTLKWFPQRSPEEQTTTDATSSSELLPEHDDREGFRRKFAIAASKAGIPIPGHLSPQGKDEDKMIDLLSDTTTPGGFGSDIIAPNDLKDATITDRFFPYTYRPQIPEISGSSSVPPGRQRWRCSVEGCTKRFKSKQALKYHDVTGHGKNDRECSSCGKVCKGDKNHKKHVAKCLSRI